MHGSEGKPQLRRPGASSGNSTRLQEEGRQVHVTVAKRQAHIACELLDLCTAGTEHSTLRPSGLHRPLGRGADPQQLLKLLRHRDEGAQFLHSLPTALQNIRGKTPPVAYLPLGFCRAVRVWACGGPSWPSPKNFPFALP